MQDGNLLIHSNFKYTMGLYNLVNAIATKSTPIVVVSHDRNTFSVNRVVHHKASELPLAIIGYNVSSYFMRCVSLIYSKQSDLCFSQASKE